MNIYNCIQIDVDTNVRTLDIATLHWEVCSFIWL